MKKAELKKELSWYKKENKYLNKENKNNRKCFDEKCKLIVNQYGDEQSRFIREIDALKEEIESSEKLKKEVQDEASRD